MKNDLVKQEAARAGEAGRGFVVVANEVRNLAAKSDEAAKATRELIEKSIEAVSEGSRVLGMFTEALDRQGDVGGKPANGSEGSLPR